ncbi:MAG: DinB family protein [Gemmatimonadota bacterium]
MQHLIEHLVTSRNEFLEPLHGLSPAQWTFRVGEERWSTFEVLEHVATVDAGVCQLLSDKLFAEPATPEQKAQARGKDELIIEALRDRSRRMESPQFVKPKGRWPAPAEAIAAFEDTRDKTIETLAAFKGDLRDYAAPHPILQTLDGYQWVLFMIAHGERHHEQILEIRREPGFPS